MFSGFFMHERRGVIRLKRLDTKLNEPINQNSTKVPKVVEPKIRKHHHKTLGTSVINNLMS